MPDVYENKYLNSNRSKPWAFEEPGPDIVSISLGTNDLSDGDGIHARAPFNRESFIQNYILFIETIYRHYPDTKIVLLSSPILSGSKRTMLEDCLTEISRHFKDGALPKEIPVFFYDSIFASGCDGHPGKEDHEQMAELLYPFFNGLLSD
jgi:hypothetical protein